MEDNRILIMNKETKAFLYDYLNKLDLHDCKVYFTLASNPCDSYLGVVAKAEILCKNSKFHWIIKSAVQKEYYRFLLPLSSIFSRETYAYEKILVEFDRLQEEKGVLHPFKSYAKYLTSSFLPLSECIIMEDMTQWGYKIQNRDEPLDYNHVMLVMREYGRFHALSFALRDQKPSLFEEISKNIKEIILNYPTYLKGVMSKVISTQIDRVINVLDPVEHSSAYQKCVRFKKHAIASIRSSVQPFVAGNYGVVCHGDCWTNNILFKYADSQNSSDPSEVCFIDWQLCRIGSPALDLSCFIFNCTDQQFRCKYYDAMLKEYYESMCTFLIQLGSNPKELFPFDMLKLHLKMFSVYGFYMAIQLHYFAISEREEIPDVQDLLEEDNFDKIEYSPEKIDKYNMKIREIILDFDKLGYNL